MAMTADTADTADASPRKRQRSEAADAAASAPAVAGGCEGDGDAERWFEQVLADWTALEQAPEECRSDPELVVEALRLSAGEAMRFAAPLLRSSYEFVATAAREVGLSVLQYAEPALRGDRGFLLGLAAHFPLSEVLGLLGEAERLALAGDRAFVLEAAGRVGAGAVAAAAPELKCSHDFMLEAARQVGPLVLEHAHTELRGDAEFWEAVSRQVSGHASKASMPPPLLAVFAHFGDGRIAQAEYWVQEEGGGRWDVEGLLSDYQAAAAARGRLDLVDAAVEPPLTLVHRTRLLPV